MASQPVETPTPSQPRLFVYPPGLDAHAAKTARNRRLGCWPLFCGFPVVLALWVGFQGGPDAWIGWCVAAAFVLAPIAFEVEFAKHRRRTNELASGWLSYDGSRLRQHSPEGDVIATIDTTSRFFSKTWSVAGNYVATVWQGDQTIRFTSDLDGAKYLAAEVLDMGDPGDTSGA